MTSRAAWYQTVGTGWAALTMTSIASLANGNASFSSAGQLDNTTNLWTDGYLSVSLASTATAAGAPTIGIYLLPLNEDGTTYGDNTSGTTVPSQAYFFGNITLQPSLSSTTLVGGIRLGQIDATKYTVVVVNNLGNAFGLGTIVVKVSTNLLNLNA